MTSNPPPTNVLSPRSLVTPAPPRPPVPGFVILEELGRGGMGVVYKAVQSDLNRVVALKMVLGGDHAGGTERRRFLAEAEAVAAVRHPNVVQVYQFGFGLGLPYLVMEYLGGGTLSRRLVEDGPPTPAEAARVVGRVARGVQAAHEAGVVHRDLKPGNVLFDEEGSPKVADFGLAKRADGLDLTATGVVMGTPAYMAPEQMAGKAGLVGPGCDVYALGAILYECLTGRPPFDDGPPADLLARVARDDPPPARSRAPGVPRDLDLVCLKCLEKEPAARYPSAAALADDLDRFLAGEPVTARRAGRAERVVRWACRHPARAGGYALAVVAVGLLAVSAGAAALWRTAEADRARAEAATAAANDALAREGLAREELAVVSSARAVELANRAHEANDTPRLLDALGACRADHRFWEWRFLHRAAHRELAVLRAGPEPRAVAYAPDGSLLAGGGGGLLRWEAGSVRPVRVRLAPLPPGVAFSSDGTRVVVFGDGPDLTLVDTATGRPVWSVPLRAERVAFSPDGTRLVATGLDRSAHVLDAADGRSVRTLTSDGTARCVAVGPTADRVAVGGTELIGDRHTGVVRVWDGAGRSEVVTPGGHDAEVALVAVSPDGTRLATVARDGGLKFWDAGRRAENFTGAGGRARAAGLAFSPDGRLVATAGRDRVVRVWDAASGVERFTFRGHPLPVRAVAFSPDGGRVASAGEDGDVRTWDVSGPPDAFRLAEPAGIPSVVTADPIGGWVAVASEAGAPQVVDPRTGRRIHFLANPPADPVRVLVSADGGRRLIGVTAGGEVREWDVRTGAETAAPRRLAVGRVVAVSADLSRVVACEGRVFRVHDARTGSVVSTLTGPAADGTTRAALSPDGRRVATGGRGCAAHVWDADTGREVLGLSGHTCGVWSAAFSPDGTRVATGGEDGTVVVWDTRTGQAVLTLGGRGVAVGALGFGEGGGRLLACDLSLVVSGYDAGPPR